MASIAPPTPVPAAETAVRTNRRPAAVPHPARRLDRLDWAIAVMLFALSLGLYAATMAPTITTASSDNPELVVKVAQFGVAHPPGSPSYVWLGFLASLVPLGEVAVRVAWLSALMGALTVVLLYVIAARHLSRDRAGALAGALFFGLSATFWSQSNIAELYVPSMALLALCVLSLLEWGALRRSGRGTAHGWLALGLVAFGYSLGIHLSNALYIPAFALFILADWPLRLEPGAARRTFSRADFARGAGAIALGSLAGIVPYVWLYFTLPLTPMPTLPPMNGPSWERFDEYTLSSWDTWRFFYLGDQIPGRLGILLDLLWTNFGPVGIVLAIVGVVRLFVTHARAALMVVLLIAANLTFYVTYRAPDIQVFYIPTFAAAALFIACGTEALVRVLRYIFRSRAGRSTRSGVAVGALGALAAFGMVWNLPQTLTYNDRGDDLHLRDFYGNLLREIPQGSYYYGRWAPAWPLRYYRELYGVRPDLNTTIGSRYGEPPSQPWPTGPAFSNTTSRDIDIPNFLWNPTGDSPKWFEPYLFGMFRWHTQVLTETGWLKTFRVLPEPPDDWLLPVDDLRVAPQNALNMEVAPGLTLVSVDYEPRAEQGRPWRITRYWRATSPDLPHVATLLADDPGSEPLALEYHQPLNGQLPEYMAARGISPEDLPRYLIRDEVRLVLPSYVEPGRYAVEVAMVTRKVAAQLYDPGPATESLLARFLAGEIRLSAAPPLDPLSPDFGR
ncbi:MAG TPA: DUF2723 domain-containing protein [Chloroflexia bacterium]|nr:DUF2723 domain-containing protein [Chloroflexia bacterium]